MQALLLCIKLYALSKRRLYHIHSNDGLTDARSFNVSCTNSIWGVVAWQAFTAEEVGPCTLTLPCYMTTSIKRSVCVWLNVPVNVWLNVPVNVWLNVPESEGELEYILVYSSTVGTRTNDLGWLVVE